MPADKHFITIEGATPMLSSVYTLYNLSSILINYYARKLKDNGIPILTAGSNFDRLRCVVIDLFYHVKTPSDNATIVCVLLCIANNIHDLPMLKILSICDAMYIACDNNGYIDRIIHYLAFFIKPAVRDLSRCYHKKGNRILKMLVARISYAVENLPVADVPFFESANCLQLMQPIKLFRSMDCSLDTDCEKIYCTIIMKPLTELYLGADYSLRGGTGEEEREEEESFGVALVSKTELSNRESRTLDVMIGGKLLRVVCTFSWDDIEVI